MSFQVPVTELLAQTVKLTQLVTVVILRGAHSDGFFSRGSGLQGPCRPMNLWSRGWGMGSVVVVPVVMLMRRRLFERGILVILIFSIVLKIIYIN